MPMSQFTGEHVLVLDENDLEFFVGDDEEQWQVPALLTGAEEPLWGGNMDALPGTGWRQRFRMALRRTLFRLGWLPPHETQAFLDSQDVA